MSRLPDEGSFAVIPTGYDPGSYTCVRSLSRQGVGTVIASELDDVPAAASRFCDHYVSIPSAYDDLVEYKDALVDLARAPTVRTILPMRPQDPYIFSKYAEEFTDHVSLVTPSLETLGTIHDRIKLYETALEAGVPMPDTKLLGESTHCDRDVIVKSRYNILTDHYVPSLPPDQMKTVKSVEYFKADTELDTDCIRDQMGHEPIVQEFIPASGQYVFGAIYDHGEPLATFQHRQIRGDSYTGGGGVFRKSIQDSELEAVGRRILDSINWHGLACIEFAKDANTGEFKLLEINPRMWQSLPCAVRAGADFPLYYWLQATDRKAEIDPEYRIGVGTHMLYGEVGYLQSLIRDESPIHERPPLVRELISVLGSCLTAANFDNFRLDDPIPFIRGLKHVLTK